MLYKNGYYDDIEHSQSTNTSRLPLRITVISQCNRMLKHNVTSSTQACHPCRQIARRETTSKRQFSGSRYHLVESATSISCPRGSAFRTRSGSKYAHRHASSAMTYCDEMAAASVRPLSERQGAARARQRLKYFTPVYKHKRLWNQEVTMRPRRARLVKHVARMERHEPTQFFFWGGGTLKEKNIGVDGGQY
jgi:hypothetical protein